MSDMILGFLLGVASSAVVTIPIYRRQSRRQKEDTAEIRTTIEEGNQELVKKDDSIQLTQREHTEILGDLASTQSEELRQIRQIVGAQAQTPDDIVRRVRAAIDEAVERIIPLEQKEIASKKTLISTGMTFRYNIQSINDHVTLKDEVKVIVHKTDGTIEVR